MVISILAILGTIAFISVNGYIKNSRDTKRTSNVAMISLGFEKNIAEGRGINTSGTSTGTNLALSGTALTMTGYYGVVNDQLLDSLKVSSKDISIYDGFQQYVYSYFPKEQKYEIMATLELPDNARVSFEPIIDTVFAATANGYPYVKGNYTATGGIPSIMPDPSAWGSTTAVNGVRTLSATTQTIQSPTQSVSSGQGIVNGVCDPTSNGGAFVTAPTALCSAGTSTGFVDQGVNLNYTWSCLGIGGNDVSCQASHVATVCTFDSSGSTLDSCSLQ